MDRVDPMATAIGSRIRCSRATALYRCDACLALRMLEWMRTMPMRLAGTIACSQRPATHDPALQPRVLIRPQPLTYSDPLPARRAILFFTDVPCILQAGLSSTILGPTDHWCARTNWQQLSRANSAGPRSPCIGHDAARERMKHPSHVLAVFSAAAARKR